MRAIMARWIVIATLLCFALAPIIVSLTHGPAVGAASAETLAHGHSHIASDKAGGHDATDHEHQLSALVPPPVASESFRDRAPVALTERTAGPDRQEGLRRAPRI